MVWLLGAALVLNIVMIGALLGLIAVEGMRAFWPHPIEQVTLRTGERFLGVPVREEAFEVSAQRKRELLARVEAGEIAPETTASDGRPMRRLYRIGNRDLGQQPFRWVEIENLESAERPDEAVFVERIAWGVFLGVPEAVVLQTLAPAPLDAEGSPMLGAPAEGTVDEDGATIRLTRELRRIEVEAGVFEPFVVTRRYLAEGAAETMRLLRELIPEAAQRREHLRGLRRSKIGPINAAMTHLRERVTEAEIKLQRAEAGGARSTPAVVWFGALAAAGALVVGVGRASRRARKSGRRPTPLAQMLSHAGVVLAVGLVLFVWLERPVGGSMTPERYDHIVADAAARQAELEVEYDAVAAEIEEVREIDSQFRVIIRDPAADRFAPERQSTPDEPMRISQIVRTVQPNTLSAGDRLGLYLARWWEFIADDPREANTEGGVFPVIFGTVLLTILLTIVVVPLGVLAALYLREYARQGVVTSFIRIAVNNLAGVPSIVYGVFGLGFFCYTVGAYVDAGPSGATQLPVFQWWFLVGAGLAIVIAAGSVGILSTRKPGQVDSRGYKALRITSTCAWIAAFGIVAAMFVTTPYFHGFFEARLPDPTFGKRGLLWAALTLALLTLPVVIVSTEEAIAAVQPSLREASYGSGASKWQTIKRVVLPGAMPGILTGMILAMARGAGEVAPLMLVGALKWAPELPISLDAPFLHLDRSFMHLGFHIYDLGFQSPDSEAARPLVWASTLLLIAVILLLNLTAIMLRARVRRKMGSGHF
ncbi:MAG: ABC transporter permease subunit [Planctomycetota bacterium]|nr:ABC transporter permease subunit [Planctomycetota bacterium]